WRCLSGSTMTPFPHPGHRQRDDRDIVQGARVLEWPSAAFVASPQKNMNFSTSRRCCRRLRPFPFNSLRNRYNFPARRHSPTCFAPKELTTAALAIGQQVEAVLDHRAEQLGTPAAAVEDDGDPSLADQ